MLSFTSGEVAAMRRTQESAMQHRALFTPWSPTQEADSGQMINGAATETTPVPCGVDFSATGAVVESSEGTIVAHYRVRLPLEMAARARPLARFTLVDAYGATPQRPLVLEQVSEPAAGPSGLVIWARNVP